MKWFRDAEIVRLYRWQIDFQLQMFHLRREWKKSGRENLPDNIKCSCAAWAHAEKLDVWKRFLPKSDVCFWTLMRCVTIAQIEKRGQNTLSLFSPPLSYWNIFTEYEGRKHLDLSQWVQSGSLFRIFSTFHTHGALWVMLKRSCVQDVDGLLIWNSFHSLTMWHIWYVNWRLDSLKPSSLHHRSFSILALLKYDSYAYFLKIKKTTFYSIRYISLISIHVFLKKLIWVEIFVLFQPGKSKSSGHITVLCYFYQ